MKIELKEGKSNGIFIAESDGREAGRISYTRINDSKISIDHTIVQEEFGGKGIGQKLVMELVKFARENNLKIETKCHFAKSVFEKNKEIQDVWEG
jgi:predicted GNAT family acetyltransferase